MWRTVRFPALIPQVWLNWLHSASEEHLRALDENPSRVDFVAFYRGDRHLVEIDGPSHYAAYDEVTRSYTVDESEYARNLKIARSLQREGWTLTRVGRIEVKDAMPDEDDAEDGDFGQYAAIGSMLRILPFPTRDGYPTRPSYRKLGWAEIGDAISSAAYDDVPF
jgi:hypothetical protein